MPPYIKEGGGGRPALVGAPRRRSPPPSRSRTPPFLLLLGGGRKGERGEGKRGAPPPLLVQFGPEGEGVRGPPWPPLSLSTRAHEAHYFSRGVPVTLRHSGFLRNHPELFRCPNIVVQYINLYVSTISRLLVMSVITSGTPNKLRSSNHITHNTNHHRTLSVRTLRVRELCRHDKDSSLVNNE